MRSRFLLPFVALTVGWLTLGAAPGETADETLRQARAALERGDTDQALALADKAVQCQPRHAAAHFFRGNVHDRRRDFPKALADFTRALELDPKLAEAHNERGSVHFKLGKIEESIRDFDAYLKLRPSQEVSHWKRGISYYYAGRFDDGKRQFEGYQTVDGNDVENAVWRYLCMARTVGVAKARADLLKIGEDKRVPMRQVYELFAGRGTPNQVMSAALLGKATEAQRNERLFYAHLYLGLYYEAEGDEKRWHANLARAVDCKIGHYMWDVARVHLELRKRKEKPR
jgi:lipoprotein NlpI